MAKSYYKKLYTNSGVATTTKSTFVTAVTIDLADFPAACNATTADAVIHLDVLDVFVDQDGDPHDTDGMGNTARFHVAVFQSDAGGSIVSGNVDIVSRSRGQGASPNPDNTIRVTPTSPTTTSTITVDVESPTNDPDGDHFVAVEVTVYQGGS